MFDSIGTEFRYKLRSIRISQASAVRLKGIVFAEYVVPGEIHVFSVPELPWSLPFLLRDADRKAFERYGARLDVDLAREITTVNWSLAGLRIFVLYEVLAHELGHHLLQAHRGKRIGTVCRRSDHERRAELQSRRVKRAYGIDFQCE